MDVTLMFIYIHHMSYCKLFLYFNLCLSVMLDSFSCSFTSITFLTASCCKSTWETIQHYTYKQINVKQQLAVRNVMEVNEHKRLSNITLRHKLKYRNSLQFLYFNLCLSVMLDSLSCSFTSITFLTASCFFTLICV
jgi:hypothetical protein